MSVGRVRQRGRLVQDLLVGLLRRELSSRMVVVVVVAYWRGRVGVRVRGVSGTRLLVLLLLAAARGRGGRGRAREGRARPSDGVGHEVEPEGVGRRPWV